jgi:hypothetical protein
MLCILAFRALLHAEKYMHDGSFQDTASKALVLQARQKVGETLDQGRGEEMMGT